MNSNNNKTPVVVTDYKGGVKSETSFVNNPKLTSKSDGFVMPGSSQSGSGKTVGQTANPTISIKQDPNAVMKFLTHQTDAMPKNWEDGPPLNPSGFLVGNEDASIGDVVIDLVQTKFIQEPLRDNLVKKFNQ